MSLEERKQAIIKWVQEIEYASSLEALESIRDAHIANLQKIVGRHVDGRPFTKAELLRQIKISEVQFERGEFYSQEEVLKMSKAWRR